MFRGIVKVQRPIASTNGTNELLIYSEDRSVELFYEADEEEIEYLFPDEEYKTYWLAEGKNGGLLNFIEQVEDEDW